MFRFPKRIQTVLSIQQKDDESFRKISVPGLLWNTDESYPSACPGSGESVKVTNSHSILSDSLRPRDCSPPGSSVYGSLQARILEWVAVPFSRGSS